jgi:hypothetical protein
MKFRSFSIVAALVGSILFAGAFAQTSTSVTYKYSTLAFPGASSTTANGINNGNVVVGAYTGSSNLSHGYIYSGGNYTAVDYPGSSQTAVLGINDNNDIVGWYLLPGGANNHGFMRHNGVFSTIDFPNSMGTTATGVNKAGTIVGSYGMIVGGAFTVNGFVYQNGAFTTLNAPQQPGESPDTQLNGINNLGWITGQVFSFDNWRGFWVIGNDFDFLEPLGAIDNQVNGANGRGDIVGCHDLNTPFIAFNVEGNEGSESTEKFPKQQSLAGCAFSINYARVIVGNSGPGGGAFLGIPALTLNVTSPANKSTNSNPVHVAATASGSNPISQMQVWVNSKEVFHVSGGTLSANITLPVGTNERFVVQAVDSKGVIAKVVETITVH